LVTTALAAWAVLGSGLAAGVLFSTVLGMVPMMRVLPYDRYIEAHQFLVQRYDPVMPMLMAATLVADAVLAVRTPPGAGRTLYAAAALLIAMTMAVSITRNVPINRWVRRLDPQTPPADWPAVDPRPSWRAWNLLRTLLDMLALTVNAVAVALP
jgi:uncharacterized membrane protein